MPFLLTTNLVLVRQDSAVPELIFLIPKSLSLPQNPYPPKSLSSKTLILIPKSLSQNPYPPKPLSLSNRNLSEVLLGVRQSWCRQARHLPFVSQHLPFVSEHHPEAAWKLFILVPRMLLRPTDAKGSLGKAVFQERMRRFQAGDWETLIAEATSGPNQISVREFDEEQAQAHRPESAERKVRIREVSRARTLLTSAGLAPGNDETWQQLTHRDLRPRDGPTDLPPEALQHRPASPLELDKRRLIDALRGAGRGSAPDLAGMRYEHLRVLIDDEVAWARFHDLAQDFARARVPSSVMQALRLGRMTALKKEDSAKIRGIVAGSILRRLVCKAVARQYGDSFLERTSPFQFALQTKAGTDALARALRFLADRDPDAVIVSLDGVGAFDHVRRSAFFRRLHACPELRELLPLVSALYGSQSRFIWYNSAGEQRVIEQGEGGEQGCPLMPALYALAQHDALVEASGELLPDEKIFSFLDDLYLVTCKARAYEAFLELSSRVEAHAGVQSHLGKLSAWSKAGGAAPVDLNEHCPGAWRADMAGRREWRRDPGHPSRQRGLCPGARSQTHARGATSVGRTAPHERSSDRLGPTPLVRRDEGQPHHPSLAALSLRALHAGARPGCLGVLLPNPGRPGARRRQPRARSRVSSALARWARPAVG